MIYIFLAMILYSISIIFGSAASRNTDSNLAAAIINIVSALIPIAVVIPIISKKLIVSQKFGVLMSISCGICIALFVMSINKAYALNKVGIVVPLVFGGAIFISTILSYFIFKEKISILQLAGLMFVGVGFSLITVARVTGK